MKKWAKRAAGLLAVIVVLSLVWMAVRAARPQPAAQFPAELFGGGAVTVEFEVECTTECLLEAVFVGPAAGQRADVAERLPPGAHLRTVKMPSGVAGKVDVLGLSPKPEDKLILRIRSNKITLYDGTSTIHRGLWSGIAHGVVCEDMPVGTRPATPACWAIQTSFDDFSKPRRKSTEVLP